MVNKGEPNRRMREAIKEARGTQSNNEGGTVRNNGKSENNEGNPLGNKAEPLENNLGTQWKT